MSRCLFLALLLSAWPAAAQPAGTLEPIGVSEQGPPFVFEARRVAVAPDGTVWARSFGNSARVGWWEGDGWAYTTPFTSSSVPGGFALGPTGTPYVSGTLQVGTGPYTRGVVRWTGTDWARLGDDLSASFDDRFDALALLADGTVVVGGRFDGPDGSNVARWDGAAWQSVGSGLGGTVRALAEGADGMLYAGGLEEGAGNGVPLTGVMRWDGAAWSSIGDLVWGGSVGVIDQVVAATDGRVAVRGRFDTIDGVAATDRALWTGTEWQPLGDATFQATALEFGPDDILWATGPSFAPNDGTRLWRWTGAEWEAVTETIGAGGSTAARALAFAPDGSVVVGGDFASAGASGAEFVGRWTGDEWQAFGSRVNGIVHHAAAAPGGVYVAGEFTTTPGAAAQRVALWTGTAWQNVGETLTVRPQSLAVSPDGVLYAGGFFLPTGAGETAPVARLDGEDWTLLADPAGPFSASALTVWDGAPHITAADIETDGQAVFRWTGTAWQRVGGAFEDESFSVLAAGPDGALYLGGSFSIPGFAQPVALARLDGAAWTPVLTESDGWDSVQSLAAGADGAFYAGGDRPGSNGGAFARRVGTSWETLDPPPFSDVTSLAVAADGTVYSGARPFHSQVDDALMAWDGSAWERVAGVDDSFHGVAALAFDPSGALFVGGRFDLFGGVLSPHAVLYRAGIADASEPDAAVVGSLSLVPNPASRRTTVAATVPAGPVEVALFDALGRRVRTAFSGESAGRLDIDLSLDGLAPGVYVVRIATAEGVASERLVVTR